MIREDWHLTVRDVEHMMNISKSAIPVSVLKKSLNVMCVIL